MNTALPWAIGEELPNQALPLHAEFDRWAKFAQPIAVHGKKPKRDNWTGYDATAERAALSEGDNIGVLGGSPLYGGDGVLCFNDLDFDDAEAEKAARSVLALANQPYRLTGKVGRSAVAIRVPAGTPYAKIEWRNKTAGKLIAMELRATGGQQTVVEGVHPETKLRITWFNWAEPAGWPLTDPIALLAQIDAALAPLGYERIRGGATTAPADIVPGYTHTQGRSDADLPATAPYIDGIVSVGVGETYHVAALRTLASLAQQHPGLKDWVDANVKATLDNLAAGAPADGLGDSCFEMAMTVAPAVLLGWSDAVAVLAEAHAQLDTLPDNRNRAHGKHSFESGLHANIRPQNRMLNVIAAELRKMTPAQPKVPTVSGGFGWQPAVGFGGKSGEEWPAMRPQPLPGAKPLPPFKVEWLPVPFRKRVTDLAAHLNVPLGHVATAIYGWAGGAIGGRCAVRPRPQNTSWLVVPNVWVCLVGRPSDKKSPVVDQTGKHLRRIHDAAEKAWRSAKGGYDTAAADHEKVIKKMVDALARAKANSEDAEVLEKRIAEARDKAPIEPEQPFYVVGGFSPEALAKFALQDNPGGVVIHLDELVHALRAADPVLKPNERALLLKLFAGTSAHQYMSIAQGVLNIPHAVASLIGTTQIKSLANYREELDAKGNDGMLARILFDASAPVPYAEPTEPMDRRATQLVQRIFEMLTSIIPQGVGALVDTDEDGEHGLPFVQFTPEAQLLFDRWYAENETARRETEDDDLAELMGKHDKRCATLALIHALVEWLGVLIAANLTLEKVANTPAMPWGDGIPRFKGVGRASTQVAVEMMGYYNAQAEALLTASQPTARALRKLAERIINGDVKSGMTVGQVAHLGWSGITHKTAQDLFEELENLGWLRLKQARVANRHGGRPTFVITLHPDVVGATALLPKELGSSEAS